MNADQQLKNLIEIADLQEELLNININDENSFNSLSQKLSDSPLLNSKWTFRSVLVSIYTCYLCRPHSGMSYVDFFIKIAKHPKNSFLSDDYILSFTNYFFLYHLLQVGLINISSIYEQSNQSNYMNIYFYPEIKQHYPNLKLQDESALKYIKKNVLNAGYQFEENDIQSFIQKFTELRCKGENPDLITASIRKDDVEHLQQLLSQTNTPINKNIDQSIFERFVFINDDNYMPTLIEYAAFFGSIECFKFLYQKLQSLPPMLAHFAVAGGNYEIIHLCELKKVIFDDDSLMVSIRFFKPEISAYLEDNFNIKKTINCASKAIVYYNLRALMDCEEVIREDPNKKNYAGYTILTLACLNGDLDIINYLITEFNDKIDINKATDNGDSPLCIAAEFGHLELVKYLCSLPKIDINHKNESGINAIQLATNRGYLNIIKYLASLSNIVIYESDFNPVSILEFAVASQKIDVVKFVWNLVLEKMNESKEQDKKEFDKCELMFLIHKKFALNIANSNQSKEIADFIKDFSI